MSDSQLAIGRRSQAEHARAVWGDQGDGTYKNPIIWADYSNPFLLQHDGDFYMVAATRFMGMPILHSKDLINWRLLGRVYAHLDWDDKYNHPGQAYGAGWAPSIAHQDGTFWVYCASTDGIFMTSAVDPAGPWEPPVLIHRGSDWSASYPFWDDDGNTYLFHSGAGASPLVLHRMSADGKHLLDDGVVLEGTLPKTRDPLLVKRNGYYVLFATGSRRSRFGTGSVVDAYRSKSIYGPYEHRVILDVGGVGDSPGGAGWAEFPTGHFWFLHHVGIQRHGHLPILELGGWEGDWPWIGYGSMEGGPGWLVWSHAEPNVSPRQPVTVPASSDEFAAPELGLQWLWNHNPDASKWSVIERPGYLRLRASMLDRGEQGLLPFAEDAVIFARNTLAQPIMGKRCTATTVMDVTGMADGQRAGLCLLNRDYAWIGAVQGNGRRTIKAYRNETTVEGHELAQNSIWLQAVCDDGVGSLSYSLDGSIYVSLGESLRCQVQSSEMHKLALFTYNVHAERGHVDFDWFHLQHDGPVP